MPPQSQGSIQADPDSREKTHVAIELPILAFKHATASFTCIASEIWSSNDHLWSSSGMDLISQKVWPSLCTKQRIWTLSSATMGCFRPRPETGSWKWCNLFRGLANLQVTETSNYWSVQSTWDSGSKEATSANYQQMQSIWLKRILGGGFVFPTLVYNVSDCPVRESSWASKGCTDAATITGSGAAPALGRCATSSLHDTLQLKQVQEPGLTCHWLAVIDWLLELA